MKKPAVNTIKADIGNLSIYIRSVRKFGKSSLFRDVVIAKYGDPTYGLLIKCGSESGDTLLDNINSVECATWRDFQDVKHWLINKEWIERDEAGRELSRVPLDHHIKMIAFDVVGEFINAAEKETVRLHNRENPQKKVKSILAAYGGYNKGIEMCANDLVKPYFTELRNAGFAPWYISHTRFKTIKETGSLEEEGWMQLTSTLKNDYESVIGGTLADVVLTGIIDRDIEERESADGKSKKRYSSGEQRKLYLRGTTLIDAGGRFAPGTVPEYIVFDKPNMGQTFVDIIEKGMELSKSENINNPKPYTTTEKKSAPAEDEVDDEEDDVFDLDESETETATEPTASEPEDDEDDDLESLFDDEEDDVEEEPFKKYPDDIREQIAKMHRKCENAGLRTKINEMVTPYKRLSNVPQEKLEQIYDMLSE